MASRMRNLLKLNTKKRKAQFFVLSAYTIVALLYIMSSWIQPYTIIDTSAIALIQDPYVFNNIKEKVTDVAKLSKDCEELKDNLEEYKQFVENYALEKGYKLDFYYSYPSCNPSETIVDFEIRMTSIRMTISSTFSIQW